MTTISRTLSQQIDKYFSEFLDDNHVTEICFNGQENRLFVLYDNGKWKTIEKEISKASVENFVRAIASDKGGVSLDEAKPILSAKIPERIQIVMNPATKKEYISLTIRKPSQKKITMEEYEKQGIFNLVNIEDHDEDILLEHYEKKEFQKFIIEAVKKKKTIIVAGATGSGKTTFLKTLIDYIPMNDRIISIEDVEELVFDEDRNFVQLFYPSEAKSTDFLNASTLTKSLLRMRPDNIILAELRGGETFDFINIINTGHGGSMSSCHAGSVEEAFSRLIMMSLLNENAQQMPYDAIKEMIYNTIDVMIHIDVKNNQRHISEIYYKDATKEIK